MDVLMPDGTTITGVPEGITQSELLARYNKFSAAKSAAPAGLTSLAKPEPMLSPEEQMMGAVGAAPQEKIPRLPGGQAEMRPYEPSLTDQLMELLPGNKYKAANEYAARQIAKERGVPVGEIYKDIGGARPMFNPEGRAPIRAGVEAAKITAQELPKVPEATLSTFLKAYRAGDIEAPADAGMVDKAIAAMKPTDAKGKPDPNYESFLGLGESLGFSVATMVASLTAAAAGEVVGGPIGGVSAGMAASGAMAYRASKDDFLSRVRDKLNGESQKLYGTNISPEDWNKAKQEYNQAAVEYGAWEAIPEAVSNAVFIKAFASPVKTGRGAAKMNSLIEKVGSQGVEQATETMTALGQNAAEMKAGLSDEELTIADAFRQQFIQTLLIGGTMAGGMKAKEVGNKFYREVVEPRVRPGSALAKAIQADVDAVAFNPESTRRAAVEALNPNRAQEQVVAEPGIASLIQKQQIAMPPPPEEPEEEALTAPPSKSQDTDSMLREALGELINTVNYPQEKAPEVVVETPEFDATGWTKSEKTINKKTGELNIPEGVERYTKEDEDGTSRRVLTRNGEVTQSETTTPTIELTNSVFGDEGETISGRIKANDLNGTLYFFRDDNGQIIKMSPRASQQYKEGVPVNKIAELEFSDAGGIRPDGTKTPNTTTSVLVGAKPKPAAVESPVEQPPSTELIKQVLPEPAAKERPSTPVIYNAIIDGWQGNANKLPKETLTWMTDNGLIKGGSTTPLGQRLMDTVKQAEEAYKSSQGVGSLEAIQRGEPMPTPKSMSMDQVDEVVDKFLAANKPKTVEAPVAIEPPKEKASNQPQGKDATPETREEYPALSKTEVEELGLAPKPKVEKPKEPKIDYLNHPDNVGSDASSKREFDNKGKLQVAPQNIADGGTPFKSRAAADAARKNYPDMRVLPAADKKGFILAPKTPKQIAADKAKAKRLGLPMTTTKGTPMAAHQFITSEGGITKAAMKDLGMDENVRSGNRSLFTDSGMSMEQAYMKLQEAGYLEEGATQNDARNLITESVKKPKYRQQDTEEMAKRAELADYADYLKAEEEASLYSPVDEEMGYEMGDFEGTGYEGASPEVQAEVRALLAQADALGINTESIREEIFYETENQSIQAYYKAFKSALEDAITASRQDRIEDTGQPGGEGTEFKLTSATPDEIRTKLYETENRAKEEERAKKAAEDKARADEQAAEFTLTGSDRAADVAAARGQKDIFAEDNTFNPVELGEEFPEIGAEAFVYLDTTNAEVRKAIGNLYKKGDIDGAIAVLENMPKNVAVVEKPKDNKQEIADLKKEQKTLMLQIIKAGLEETPEQEARMAEIDKRLRELEGKPAIQQVEKPVAKQRSVEEIQDELQDLEDQLDLELNKEKRKSLVSEISKLQGELTAAEGRAARAAAEKPAAPTEAEIEAAEEAAEEAIRNKAEAEIDEGPIGQAIAKIENGDIETKAQIRSFIKKLERDGVLDDVEDVREGLSDREQDASEVLDTLSGLLDDARDSAIDERVDELLEERAQEEPVEEPSFEVETPEGNTLSYPAAFGLVNTGYTVLALNDPRTYTDKGGTQHRTFEKDGARIAVSPNQVLFEWKGRVQYGMGNPNELTLEMLAVDPKDRGKGKGTQVLKDLTKVADQYGITLYGEPVPIVNLKQNDVGLDFDQLVNLYKKFDFKFQETDSGVSERVIVRQPEAEVLPAAEPQIAGQVGFEPYTIEGDFTEVAEEQQRLMLEDQTENLSDDQVSTLEKHYGAKVDSDEFFTKLREDVSNFIVKGATAVNGKIRAIIRQLANGVLAVGIAFNPQYMSQPLNVMMPIDNVRTEEVLAKVPDAATAKMSEPAKRAFAVIYPALQEQMMAKDKLFIMADKPSGRVFVFNPDGSLLLEKKSLFGLAKGDIYVGDNDKPQNRITPAGLFDLKFVDAQKGESQKRTAGDYDTGTVLAINDPDGTITIMHSVWLKEKDAAQRAAALRNESPADSRYSFGCINVDAPTYKYMVDNHAKQMDGAALFIVPEAGVDVMSFITGKGAMSEDLARIKVKPVTKEVRTPQKQATQAEAQTKTPGREERLFFSVEGKKLPPGRSPELAAAARQVKEGKMTAAEFDKLVNKYKPIRPYEAPLKPATRAEMVDALSSEKKDKVNPDIPEGTRVGLRLDIPAFNRKGVYVVTIHEKGNASGPGKAIGYDSVAVINNVNFGTGSQKKALNIATGEAKDALQTMEGEFVKSDPAGVYAAALKAMDDPSWTQIGVDPTRHTYFFDRNTTQPVIAAEQVIQIGNTVLAKNVTYGRKEDFLYNLEDDLVKLVNDTADSIDEANKKRSPSFKRKAKTLTNQRNEGKLTDEEYLDRMNAAIAEDEESRLGVDRKDRVRGADFIREKLLNAKRNGFLSDEAVDLAEWFIGQNPALVDDLGISIKAKGPEGAGGFYNPLARIITLIKERGSDLTTTHEILHHLERMMPAKIRAAIRKAWLTQLLKANKATKDPAQKLYFMALLDAHIGNNNHTRLEIPKGSEGIYKAIVEQMKFANELTGGRGADPKSSALARELLLYSPTVPSELYEYFDPSEFWAVNGSDIVRARYDAVKGGVLARLKNWLREFAEKVKSLFGMKSDASIIRALDSLAKSDGKFVTDEMLGTGDYQNIKKNALGGEMPEATWAMRESTFGNDWMQRWQDNYRDLKNVQKSITEQIGKIDDRLNAYRKQTVNPGREAERQGDFVKYEVDPLVKEMIANRVSNQELATYLHNRYAEERNEIINAKNKNPAVQNQGSGISTENARKYMEALPADRAQVLESLAKRIDAIVRGSQDLLVQSGQETQETIDGWRQSSPHYVPLQRDESELDFIVQTGTGSLGGYATAGKFGKEAIGSTKTVKNILENVMLQRDRAIRRAESIRIGQALYGMAIQYPNPDFWMAINPDAVNDIDALIAEMEEMGLDPELIENILEQPKTGYVKKSTGPEGETVREVKYRVDRAYQNAKNVFPIRINGQNRYVLFNPKSPEALRLAAELKQLNPEQLNLFFGVASSFSRWFAAVNTQYNPVFGLVNFWNDTQGALINLSTTPLAGQQSAVLKNVLPAMHGIARDIRKERKQTVKSPIKTAYGKEIDSTDWTNLWRLYRNGGGKTAFRDQMVKPKLNVEWKGLMPNFSYTDSHTMLEALEKIEQGPISKKVEWWADCFSDFNDTLENTVRLSVFKVGYIDMKLPIEEAIDIAKNITVDFNRRGGRTKNVRGMYVFFNAALQSNVRIAVTLAGPAGKTIVKAGLAMGALNAMWMFLAGFDDDDPPQFTRNKGFIVPTGDGDYFLWNLPQGWRAIPNTGRLVTEGVLVSLGLMKSNKGMAGKISDASGVVFDAINPFGGGTLLQTLAPTFLDPAMALAENKDSFGRPIFKEDQSLKPTPGWQRTRDSASTFSKGLSWLLNYVSSGGEEFDKGFISPTGDQLDYLISQAAGGFARDVKRTGEWAYNAATGEETPSYRRPVLNRFIGETKTDAAASARFYDNVTMLARHENIINGRIENKGDVQGYLKENPLAKFAFVANEFENEVSSINKTIRDLQNMDETPARKQQIKDLKATRIEIMRNFNNMVRQAQ